MQSAVIHTQVEGVGRPLALVHELGGSLDSFELLVPRLTDRFRVLRYDQPGCGASPPCSAPATLAGEAERLLELISRTFGSEPCRVVAVAAGAAIAVTAARARPGSIAALALCAPALDVPPHRRSYLLTRAARAEAKGMAAIAETSLERSYPAEIRRDAAAFERYRARFLANDAMSYATANRSLADAEILDELPELRLPCLFLAGHHDGLRPPHEVERLSQTVPGAAYATVESGHIMPMQAPAQMAEHLRAFFRRVPKTVPETHRG